MNIYLTTSKIGRLADKRIRIAKCANPRLPSEFMDLVFTDKDIENQLDIKFCVSYGSESSTFATNPERLAKYFDDNKANWSEDALKSLAAQEKTWWEAYFHGKVFDVIVERWNAAEREWTPIDDATYDCYGSEDALEIVNDLKRNSEFDACVVTCEDDCANCFTISES